LKKTSLLFSTRRVGDMRCASPVFAREWTPKSRRPFQRNGFVTDCIFCTGQNAHHDHCDGALEEWKALFPDLYRAFDAARNKQDEDFEKLIDERVNWRVCPLCRASMDAQSSISVTSPY